MNFNIIGSTLRQGTKFFDKYWIEAVGRPLCLIHSNTLLHGFYQIPNGNNHLNFGIDSPDEDMEIEIPIFDLDKIPKLPVSKDPLQDVETAGHVVLVVDDGSQWRVESKFIRDSLFGPSRLVLVCCRHVMSVTNGPKEEGKCTSN
jgi:hypothetical protein